MMFVIHSISWEAPDDSERAMKLKSMGRLLACRWTLIQRLLFIFHHICKWCDCYSVTELLICHRTFYFGKPIAWVWATAGPSFFRIYIITIDRLPYSVTALAVARTRLATNFIVAKPNANCTISCRVWYLSIYCAVLARVVPCTTNH